jgi:hypothetical protein
MWQALQQTRRQEAAVVARLQQTTQELNTAKVRMDEAAALSRAALAASLQGADKEIAYAVQKAALQRSLDVMEESAHLVGKFDKARAAKPTDAYTRALQATEASMKGFVVASENPANPNK